MTMRVYTVNPTMQSWKSGLEIVNFSWNIYLDFAYVKVYQTLQSQEVYFIYNFHIHTLIKLFRI
jgi:hypothetical protein